MKIGRVMLVLSLVFGVVVAAMILHVSQLQAHLIHSMAFRTVELYSVALTQFRSLYTSEVVRKARAYGLDATHDYASRDDAIPLPATLGMLLGEKIGQQTYGAKSRLYSPYPFPWRAQENKSLPGGFEKQAWQFLNAHPEKPYYRFERRDNGEVLRYATADVMRSECVACHNTHPDSPKTDWKVGDVRGVLEIDLPLDDITAQTTADLRKISIAYALVGLGMASVIGVVLVKLLQQSSELKQRVDERTTELRSEIAQRVQAMDALTEMEAHNRLLLDSAGEGICGLDRDGKTVFVNPAACEMLGYDEPELLCESMHALVHHSYADGTPYPRERCLMAAACNDDSTHRVTDEVLWRKDGSCFSVEYTSTPMHRDGEPVGSVVVFNDITERKKMEERFRLGIEASPVAMIMVGEEGAIVHGNRAAEKLFGYEQGQLIGESVERLLPDAERGRHVAERARYVSDPSYRRMGGRDLSARKRSGEIFPVEVSLNPIHTADGIVILCAVVDLTERKKFETTILGQARALEQANSLLSEQATTDSLTNIANRRGLSAQLATLLLLAHRNGRPVSMLMIDIDDFKQYNDAFGHPAGDQVLRTVARAMTDAIRDSDFAARYGGEEFAVLLAETGHGEASIVAEKIRKNIEIMSSLERAITVSIGAATLVIEPSAPFDATRIGEQLIAQADKALYRSKRSGKNRVTHYDVAG